MNKLIVSDELDKNINISEELVLYKDDLDFDILKSDLNIWYKYKKSNDFDSTKISSLSKQFMLNNLHAHLIELHKLFIIYLSVPVSTASGERSFSTLNLLKTYIRFHPFCLVISKFEDSQDYSYMFKTLKDLVLEVFDYVYDPTILVADSAHSITHGFESVYPLLKRVVC